MNNVYRYRWWWLISLNLIIMVFIYLAHIQPGSNRIKDLNKQIALLIIDINKHKKLQLMSAKRSVSTSKLEEIARLSEIASASTVVVQSVQVHSQTLHLQLQGEFKHIVNFIQQLKIRDYPASIVEYAYQTPGRMDLTILLHSQTYPQSMRVELNNAAIHSPFCNANEEELIFTEKNFTVPVSTMRMMGYLQQGTRHFAMLALPNGSVIDVFPQSLIGKERGLVTTVARDHIEVMLSGGQRIVLNM